MRLRKMRRTFKIALVLLLVAALSVPVYRHFRYQRPAVVAPKKCIHVDSPCFEVVMAGQPPLLTNGWQRYNKGYCIAFTSLPDQQFHGYCGEFKVKRTHNILP